MKTKRWGCFHLAVLYVAGNVVLAHATESNIWAERQKQNRIEVARLPSSMAWPSLPTTSPVVLPSLMSASNDETQGSKVSRV